MTTPRYAVGDRVRYVTFMDKPRWVVVTEKYRNVKNGKPGFDGYLVGHPKFSVWGYNSQIDAVKPAAQARTRAARSRTTRTSR